ncbi:MAG: hypothetical protein ACRCX5_13135 [Bacteroidales bacterium]
MKKVFFITLILTLVLCEVDAQNINKRNFQFGVITPLGTNGVQSHRTINTVSVNLIGGYSYGNKAIELSPLYNIDIHLAKGLQLSGMINYSGNSYNAVQFAGLINIVKDGTVPLQLSGVVNVAKYVNGLQFATLVNIAKKNRGVQFALFNYAEESDGISFGLVNIVKRGGKHEFEISFSEAINTVVSFKLGTDKFYTIFSGGVSYINSPVEYAAGLGMGTHIEWRKGWGNQIEAMGYSLSEQGSLKNNGINMLTQLKLTISKQFAPHFKVFAGPTINMTISDYVNPETGAIGSSLAPWSMWKTDRGRTRLNGWIGLTAGIRL